MKIAPSAREVAMRYAIVIEKAESNYSAYVSDLPGYVATGATVFDIVSLVTLTHGALAVGPRPA